MAVGYAHVVVSDLKRNCSHIKGSCSMIFNCCLLLIYQNKTSGTGRALDIINCSTNSVQIVVNLQQ